MSQKYDVVIAGAAEVDGMLRSLPKTSADSCSGRKGPQGTQTGKQGLAYSSRRIAIKKTFVRLVERRCGCCGQMNAESRLLLFEIIVILIALGVHVSEQIKDLFVSQPVKRSFRHDR
jgi:hypothetical protein